MPTVAKVMIIPKQYDTTMVGRVKWSFSVKSSSKVENTLLRIPTMRPLTASPSTTPTAADTRAYAVPRIRTSR